MGYMLIANRLDAPWGRAKFGVAPRHVQEIKDGVVTKYANGKIPRDMEFEWFGNPDNPPAWASPLCATGRAAYRKMAKRVLAQKSINSLKRMRYQTILDDLAKSETSEPEVLKDRGGSSGSSGASKGAKAIDRALRGEVLPEQPPYTDGDLDATPAKKKKAAVSKEPAEITKSEG